jgi:hypothetical protein
MLDRWVVLCICGEEKHVVLVNTTERSRALGRPRPRPRSRNNIKSTLQKQGIRAWSRLISLKTGTIGRTFLNKTMYLMFP